MYANGPYRSSEMQNSNTKLKFLALWAGNLKAMECASSQEFTRKINNRVEGEAKIAVDTTTTELYYHR
jgi:hypothetical protein